MGRHFNVTPAGRAEMFRCGGRWQRPGWPTICARISTTSRNSTNEPPPVAVKAPKSSSLMPFSAARRNAAPCSANRFHSTRRCRQLPHYRIASPLEKSCPGRQFTGKNPPRLAASQAGRIFTGKLSAGKKLFLEERSYNGDTFLWLAILVRGRHMNFVIISFQTDFSWDRHFNVTPSL